MTRRRNMKIIEKITLLSAAAILTLLLVPELSIAQETTASVAQTKNYAVVDVKKVVNASKSVKALKAERKKQNEAIAQFIKDGNAQLNAEKDQKKKDALKKSLNNDLKYMTQTYDKKYKENLVKVNKEILTEIAQIGKTKQYDLILTTDAVLYGGENITKEVIKEVK